MQIAQFNEPNLIGSEDCLWLNVYAPTKKPTEEKKLKPVLVWIYGGRFLVGTASSQVYSPHFMMDQDLVMVSIQWRVGPYGFLSTESQEAPGTIIIPYLPSFCVPLTCYNSIIYPICVLITFLLFSFLPPFCVPITY